MEKHDFKAALETLEMIYQSHIEETLDESMPDDDETVWLMNDLRKTIQTALRLAERLQSGEVSREMERAGISPFIAAHDLMFSANEPTAPIFKAMAAQMIEEEG